ncbi:hypothetical protein EVAR_13537_1 [Eumeta japonica]|uniref:Uncharacterized protein n=1 Tax=Eumeta variegata TaxID=151549 RepID=A0A4C1U9K8_EUMVA|nr:hypothetical protein EVAR_13537_1 [Eumeta japonica]
MSLYAATCAVVAVGSGGGAGDGNGIPQIASNQGFHAPENQTGTAVQVFIVVYAEAKSFVSAAVCISRGNYIQNCITAVRGADVQSRARSILWRIKGISPIS